MSKYTNNHKTNKHLNITKFFVVFLLTLATIISIGSNFMTTINAIDNTTTLTCNKEEHVHGDACYDEEGNLTCTTEEHTHSESCYIDYSTCEDPNKTFTLTDDNASNVVTVANSFINYQEDTTHYILDGETHKNYTIFGAYAGMYQQSTTNNLTDASFNEWNYAFIEYVLNYSNNNDYLTTNINKSVNNTDSLLQSLNDASKTSTSTNDALVGNIAFFTQDNKTYAGFITAVNGETLTLVVGDYEDTVKEVQLTTSNITNYGVGIAQATIQEEQTPTTNQDLDTADEEETEEVETEVYTTEDYSVMAMSVDDDTATTSTDDTRLDVQVTTTKAKGSIGEVLKVNVITTSYEPNSQTIAVPIKIKIGKLPEGVYITDFTNNKMTVSYSSNSATDQLGTVEITLVKDTDGTYYAQYEVPAGVTLNFDLSFSSTNGIMKDGTEDQKEHTKTESITVTPVIENKTDKDKVSEAVTLTWTGKNEWKNLNKTIDKEKIAISDGKLTGSLNYTISADEFNSESIGEIWTDYIYIEDTLTLPNGISFPDGAKVSDDKKSIVTSDGKTTIFTLSTTGNTKDWTIQDLTIDGKKATYKIRIDNPYKNASGVPTKEMDLLTFSGTLNLETLKLASEIYNDVEKNADTIKKDKIKNKVSIETHGYGLDKPTYEAFKEVESYPDASVKSTISKTNDKGEWGNALPGEEVTYTITITNTGSVAITNKDVVDTLPKYLTLTEEQKKSITDTYKEATITNTVDGTTTIKIPVSELKTGNDNKQTFTIKANVIGLDDFKDSNGNYVFPSTIKNTASYNDGTDDSTIQPKKPIVDITKTKASINGKSDNLDKTTVTTGDKIIYSVKVSNKNTIESLPTTITDNLANGKLIFSKLYSDNGKTVITASSDGTFTLKTDKNNQQTIKLIQENNQIKFEVGKLAANDSFTLYYECIVNVTGTSDKSLTNQVKTTEGKYSEDKTPIKSQFTLDKNVYKSDGTTDAENEKYDDGSIFVYTISITNDKDNPNAEDYVELTDTMPVGMLPISYSDDSSKGYKIYTSSKNWSLSTTYEDSDFTEVENLTFAKYLEEVTYNDGWSDSVEKYYYTKIGDDWVKLSRTTTWDHKDFVTLKWKIAKIEAGKTVEKTYNAKMSMTTEQTLQANQGEQIKFTNKVSIKGEEDSTTVYGKEKASITIYKKISGKYTKVDSLTDAQKEQVKFKISKKGGPEVKTITLKDFVKNDASSLKYTLTDVEYGTYVIEETDGAIDGSTPEVTIKADPSGIKKNATTDESGKKITITLSDGDKNRAAEITFTNKYPDTKAVDIQKSVWALEKGEYLENNKTLFKLNGTDEYVIYNITIANTGKDDVTLTKLIDTMDSSLSYVGILGDYLNTGSESDRKEYTNSWNETTTTTIYYSRGYIKIDGTETSNTAPYKDNFSKMKITKNSNESNDNKLVFDLTESDNDNSDSFTLKSGKYVTFFVKCKVDNNATIGKNINNKISLVVDNNVEYKSLGDITMSSTKDDNFQNNGDTYEDGAYTGDSTKKLISSDVDITPIDGIVPGIEKNAVQYMVKADNDSKYTVTDFTDAKSKNVQPQSIVKWEITLYNDGTQPIKSYTLKDTIQSPWKLMSRDELNSVKTNQSFESSSS